MKQLYSIFIFTAFAGFLTAQSGTVHSVQAHQNVNLFAQDKIVVNADFPEQNVPYQNATMLLTMGCMNGDSCSHWDYDLDVYVGDSTGMMDSTVASWDTISTNPLVLDTTWNVFEVIDWYELGRYITPYGNYMNWNQNGFNGAWEQYLKYDVTDFSNLLRGDNVPIRIYFHGWQKGFRASVDFAITEGNPTRDVLNVESVYTGGSYTSFAQFDSERTPSKTLSIPADVDEAKLRVIVTGHGQSGEFTPMNYTVKANNQVVKVEELWRDDCDEIPVYPQGGTWLLGRANWCPGDAVETHEFELTDYIQGSGNNKSLTIDIDLDNYVPASGASYKMSAYLISYDSYRRDYDVLLDEIVAPSMNDEFNRFNPICDKPIVRIKNYGKQVLTYAEIEYWVDHTDKFYHDWTGSLQPGETVDVELPNMNWTGLDLANLEFFAKVDWPNNLPDQFPFNNEKSTLFESPLVFTTSSVGVRFRANNKPEENAYTIIDADGNVIANETTFTASAFNNQDFTLAPGCYVFEMTDYGTDWEAGDGISWWLNTQNGYESAGTLEFRNPADNSLLYSFQRDFGAKIRLPFLVNTFLEDLVGNSFSSPSPHPMLTPYTSPTGEEFVQVYDTIWISEDKVVYSVDAPTSINEAIDDFLFEVYPNPSNGWVSILVAYKDQKELPIRILNLIGEEVDVITVNTNETSSYDFKNLSAGFYLFSFEIEGKTITKKISVFK